MAVSDTLFVVYRNYARIWRMVTEVIANPTQGNIDNLLTTAESLGVVRPKLTYSADGESYQWESYQLSLKQLMDDAYERAIRDMGPFEVRSRAF